MTSPEGLKYADQKLNVPKLKSSRTLSINYQPRFILQGVPMQTVKSNLDQTERKNAINFNLKVDSDQGRFCRPEEITTCKSLFVLISSF